jgi:uncharacterized protein with HEPN domain
MAKQKKFVFLGHDNQDLKNQLLNYSRELRKKQGFENQLAATFIHVSFAEYLANNLVENLRYLMHQGTYNQYAGILFIDERRSRKVRTLGQLIEELRKYSFPDKEEILAILIEIKDLRNNIFHNFASADLGELERIIVTDLVSIQDKTEELLKKVNTIYTGLQKILLPTNAESTNVENQENGPA